MLALVLPQIKQEMQLSDATLGMLAGPAFVVIYAVAGLPVAWLADRWSRRWIILIGVAFWSLVTVATGLAGNSIQLAAARIALGLGEATTIAPASALVGDLFAARNRAAAFAVLTAGAPLGIMIGFPLLGSIIDEYGWRSAFFVMGALGLLLSLTMMMVVVREPVRRAAPVTEAAVLPTPTLVEAAVIAFRSRGFILLVIGGTLIGVSYGVMAAWAPSFLRRVHGLTTQQAGSYIGLYRGLFGIAASLGGGVLVTFLQRRDARWLAWMPALLCLLAGPAELLFLLADERWRSGLAIDTLLVSGATPCAFALLLIVVDARMRAVGTALYLLVFHIVGQSFGPPIIGILNEQFAPLFGALALRYSMLMAPVAMVLASLAFVALARELKR